MSTGQSTDTQSASPLGNQVSNQALINMGIPTTSQGAQFELEEEAAASARGQSYAQLWAGFKIPAADAGDFWTVYAMAETFASNTGWKYLPTPQLLLKLLASGNIDNPQQAYAWFADVMKVNQAKMPWAALGMSSTQYNQAEANVSDSLYALTGTTDFTKAGLGGIKSDALFNQWSMTHLQNYIEQNPKLSAQYGYLRYGQNYQQFSAWKQSNSVSLQQRYGTKYTDAQAISELASPLQSFHASGGVFGQSVPYVAASSTMPTGHQSAIR